MPFEKGQIPHGSKPFDKGVSGNYSGRPKGSGKRAIETRIKSIIGKTLDEIEADLTQAPTEDKVKIVAGLQKVVA